MSAAAEQAEFEAWRAERREVVIAEIEKQRLFDGEAAKLEANVPEALVEAAKARSGITSNADLILYALSKVALEDDFGWKLLAMKGTIPADIDLEF